MDACPIGVVVIHLGDEPLWFAIVILLPDVQIRSRLRPILAQVFGVSIDRMAAPVETKRLLLEVELLDLGPRRHVGQRCMPGRASGLLAAAKQVDLAQVLVALYARAVLTRGIDRRQQPCPYPS